MNARQIIESMDTPTIMRYLDEIVQPSQATVLTTLSKRMSTWDWCSNQVIHEILRRRDAGQNIDDSLVPDLTNSSEQPSEESMQKCAAELRTFINKFLLNSVA